MCIWFLLSIIKKNLSIHFLMSMSSLYHWTELWREEAEHIGVVMLTRGNKPNILTRSHCTKNANTDAKAIRLSQPTNLGGQVIG